MQHGHDATWTLHLTAVGRHEPLDGPVSAYQCPTRQLQWLAHNHCIWGIAVAPGLLCYWNSQVSTHPAKIPLWEGLLHECLQLFCLDLGWLVDRRMVMPWVAVLVGRSKHDKKKPVSTYMYIHAYMY